MKTLLHVELTQLLNRFPSLTVRCYSRNLNGTTINLAQIEGILSVFFRKVKYNIPITMIYPQGYPNDPPSLYVIPTQNMMLNLNNKFVDQDGKKSLQFTNKW